MRTAISIFGNDKPGIIASLTQALSEQGLNIEDTSMTLLQDHFAMILVVDIKDLSIEQLLNLLKSVSALSELSISCSQFDSNNVDQGMDAQELALYIIHLSGDDAPGIVASVASLLSDHGANIIDCSTRKSHDQNIFTMILDAQIPIDGQDQVVQALTDLSQSFSGDLVFRRVDDVEL